MKNTAARRTPETTPFRKGTTVSGAKKLKVGFKRILVPTDFSETSKQALGYAGLVARVFDGQVSLMHVEPSAWPADVDTVPLIIKRENYREAAEAWLERCLKESFQQKTRGRTSVGMGTPYLEVAREARSMKADLIVVATHGHTGMKHVLLGSTAEHLVRHAPCPVLAVRQGGRRKSGPVKIKRVLIPTDFSDAGAAAVGIGIQLAEKLGAELSFLHVLELPSYPTYGFARIPTEERKRKRAATEQLEAVKAGVQKAPVKSTKVLVGNASHEIAAEAKQQRTDLIVISTHGSAGLKKLLLGSTAERVVRYAPCPVLVVREGALR